MTANADLEWVPPADVELPLFSPRAATRRSNTGARNATVFPPVQGFYVRVYIGEGSSANHV